MGRASLAEVDLETANRPLAAAMGRGDEVDAETPERSPPRELLADRRRMDGELRRVLGTRREAAAEVDLAGLATHDLLVRREDHDLAVGPDVDLGTRAGEAIAGDPLLDDPASGEVGEIPLGQ
jgi:hypothetical protein